ncbi:MAG: hypothetical protein JWL77_1789 [Chthonomonadaceae bacterium]|nr:hypothetical protein [Chthonomonadaceae bacterium]
MQYHKWIFLGFGALCLLVVASLLNAEHLYYMSAILLTLPMISYGLGWYALSGLTFRREMPSDSWAGEESEVCYVIENPSPVARFFLTIHEVFPDWVVPARDETPLFNVTAKDTTRVYQAVTFRRRGVYQAAGFEVTAMDPLGVFAFTRRVQSGGELVVYPTPGPPVRLPVLGAERYGWQDATSAMLRGSSVEPDGVRAYANGDSLRHIHWRQTARTGNLTVIEFEETLSQHLVLVLDLMRGVDVGTGTQTTLEYAVRLVANLAQQAVQQGAEVRLLLPTIPALKGYPTTLTGRGQEHLHLLLDVLARVEAQSAMRLPELLRQTGELMAGTRLVVLTSQTDTTLPEALARYTATGVDVSVVYLDPSTFDTGRRRAADRESFFTELLAVGVHPLVMGANAEQDLRIEAISNDRI